MSISLYNHNRQAYDSTVDMLKTKQRACIIHPTGTGKTYIGFKFIEDNQNKKILWLGPSEYIFRMQLRGVGEENPDLRRYVLKNDVFHTYAWMRTNINCIPTLAPDIIILDEFHRAGAQEWGLGVRKLIEAYPDAKIIGFTATNIRYLDGARDMAIELFDGAIASEITLVEAMARGILPIPKYVIATYDYEERLNCMQKRIDAVRSKTVKQENQKMLDKLRRNMEQSEGLEKIFAKHITKRNGKFIVFCTSTEKMYEMIARVVEWFRNIDRLPHVYAVHCYNPESEKEFRDFIEDNSDHTKLLFSIDMLNEGIHVPDVDGVILLRPTESPIVYKQQIGRALSIDRTSETVIFDMVNNFEGLNNIRGFEEEYEKMRRYYAERGEANEVAEFEVCDELRDFREMFDVILRNLDSSWDIYYDELVRRKEQTGSAYVERRYIAENGLQVGKWLSHQKQKFWDGKLEVDKAEKLMLLGIEMRRLNDVRFDRWMELLKAYKEEHNGSTCVPGDYKCETGERLGNWVSNVRVSRNNGVLSEDNIGKLDKIGFAWNPLDAMWEDNYAAAKKYFEEHGNLNISKKYKDIYGRRIGYWVTVQRNIYAENEKGNLSQERINRLEQIGMVWNPKLDKNIIFERNIELLKQYAKGYGNTYVCDDYVTEDGVKLGKWVSALRYKKKRGLMESLMKKGEGKRESYITIAQEQELERIGFHWEEKSDKWNTMYNLALTYFREHGTIHNASDSITDEQGRKLSYWLNAQNVKARKEKVNGYYKGKLSHEQMARLAVIGIPYEKKSVISNRRGVMEYKRYLDSGGNPDIHIDYVTPEGYGLGKWCEHQRCKMKANKIDCGTKQKLDELGFIWNKSDSYWEKMFRHALEYYNEHNETLPSTSYVCYDGAKLGQWISSMRKRIKQKDLPEEKVARLKTIGFK